jgi:hypothetical protein
MTATAESLALTVLRFGLALDPDRRTPLGRLQLPSIRFHTRTQSTSMYVGHSCVDIG